MAVGGGGVFSFFVPVTWQVLSHSSVKDTFAFSHWLTMLHLPDHIFPGPFIFTYFFFLVFQSLELLLRPLDLKMDLHILLWR